VDLKKLDRDTREKFMDCEANDRDLKDEGLWKLVKPAAKKTNQGMIHEPMLEWIDFK
jgi:hypothetical protein